MDPVQLQQSLFRQVKERLPAHVSLAEELASVLGVSADSAYRRIRGEKSLDIGEIAVLTRKYGVSFDGLVGQQTGGFLFAGQFLNDPGFAFPDWLTAMNEQLTRVADGKNGVFIFQSKDLPLFHHFQLPELAKFKFFFWRRTILQQEGPELAQLDITQGDETLLAMARRIYLTYCRMSSIEIWNAESLNSTLRQINYYRETDVFRMEDMAQRLFDQCIVLLDHLELQAEYGLKFPIGTPPEEASFSYQLYQNEVLLGDNTIYTDDGRNRVVFLNHSGINYLGTSDERFVEHTRHSLSNIMKRSTLISGSGEKERRRFFKGLREEVERRRQ